MVNYNDIINFIKTRLPTSKITFQYKGKTKSIELYTINIKLDDEEMQFNVGPNLVFILEGIPRGILRDLPLIKDKYVKSFIDNCLNSIELYKQNKDVPIIQSYARKYLGKEKRVEKKKKAIYVYYDKFFIIVTPELVSIGLNFNKRILYAVDIKSQNLEEIFKIISYYADSIRKGEIEY